jgi:hypothetical protein
VRRFKLVIASADDAVEAPAWDDDNPAVQTQRNLDGSIWAYSYSEGSEQWMHVPGIASFRFGAYGEEADVVLDPGTPSISPAVLEDTYLRAILPMALHAHGHEVLHASAVIMDGRVVAFCGRSQTGKSTVAFGLHRRGYRVWADDTLVLDASVDIPHAVPYPHRLRIRAEAAVYFDVGEVRRHDTSSWTALAQAQDEPAALACVFLLDRDPLVSRTVEAVRLAPTQALAGVIEHAYWFRLDDPVRMQQMVRRYFALATQVPVFRMRFHAELDQLPEMLDQVEFAVRAAATKP